MNTEVVLRKVHSIPIEIYISLSTLYSDEICISLTFG